MLAQVLAPQHNFVHRASRRLKRVQALVASQVAEVPMEMELYDAILEGWIPESKAMDLMCTTSLLSRGRRCMNGRRCLRCMLPENPYARRFVESQELERRRIRYATEFLKQIPKQHLTKMMSMCWRYFYRNLIQYMAVQDDLFIEDLAEIGAGSINERGIRRIAQAGNLIYHALWIRKVNVFGSDILVFKLTDDMEMFAMWQRQRCREQVRDHMRGMSTMKQAEIMLAIQGLGRICFMYGQSTISVWSRALTGSAFHDDLSKFFEDAQESSQSDSDYSRHGDSWGKLTNHQLEMEFLQTGGRNGGHP